MLKFAKNTDWQQKKRSRIVVSNLNIGIWQKKERKTTWMITADYKLTNKERKPIRLGASCIFTLVFLRRNPRWGTKGLDKLWQWQSVNNWPSAVAMAMAMVSAGCPLSSGNKYGDCKSNGNGNGNGNDNGICLRNLFPLQQLANCPAVFLLFLNFGICYHT